MFEYLQDATSVFFLRQEAEWEKFLFECQRLEITISSHIQEKIKQNSQIPVELS